eukprot:m.837490 g.837490  ORF g.837490 m.837490 type:complete len:600 (+) comp23461_c0_seq15:514-2313(+)
MAYTGHSTLLPPANLSARIGEGNSVILTWDRPQGLQTYFFRVLRKNATEKQEQWERECDKCEDITDKYTYTTKFLAPLTTYTFKVLSCTNLKPSGPSAEISITTGEGVPDDAPSDLKVDSIELDSITIVWSPPVRSNGEIISYTIDTDEVGSDSFQQHHVSGETHKFQHTLLEPSTPYRFQVSAHNSAGEGPLSTIIEVSTLASAASRWAGKGQAFAIGDARDASSSTPKERIIPADRMSTIRGASTVRPTPLQTPIALPVAPVPPRAPPKAVWKPCPAPKQAVTPVQVTIPERTNPDAMGEEARARRLSKQAIFESTLQADMTEAKMKELSLRKQREADIQHSNQVTKGVNNSPGVDELTRTLSRKRDNWNTLLAKERTEPLAPLVGGPHAQRLLPKGGVLRDDFGDVRGAKDGVRAAVGLYDTNDLVFKSELLEQLYLAERDRTIVVYTTSLQAIRTTRDDCVRMLKLFDLLTLKVKVKDVHLEPNFGKELAERVEQYDVANVADVLPQCFINAVHIGGLGKVEQLTDTGELKTITKDFPKRTADACAACGSYGFVLCTWCQGSNRSRVHHFNPDPRKNALKCTVCNSNGLVPCPQC